MPPWATGRSTRSSLAFTDLYGRLVGKRFDAGFFLDSIDDGTHVCDYLLTVDIDMEPVPGYCVRQLGAGVRRRAPRAGPRHDCAGPPGRNTPRSCCATSSTTTRHQRGRRCAPDRAPPADRTAGANTGSPRKCASELEFFLFDDTLSGGAREGLRRTPSPRGGTSRTTTCCRPARVEPFVRAARRALADSGIPVENSKGEWGRGQHEINIRYVDVLEMADRHTLMKHALKELADTMGLSVTFMAKPTTDEAGSSSHLHLSLWNADTGTNVFESPQSDEFRWFLGGWMAHVDDFMVCYAPTINSYKRYIDASWAPTRVAWSNDNRTAGFRIVGTGSGRRIENRIPGADCNPYLAYAATLASGLAGIEQQIEPPDAFDGDVYGAGELPHVPATLDAAVAAFDASARRTSGLRRRRRRPLRPLPRRRDRRASRRRQRLGAGPLLRAHLIGGCRGRDTA